LRTNFISPGQSPDLNGVIKRSIPDAH